MIEVEKKFILTQEQEKSLINGAEFLGEKKFTDQYYDDADFSLTKKDIWLRQRDGKCELKLPMNTSIEERVSDQYKEIENEQEIRAHFDFDSVSSIAELLKSRGYTPFCTITTTRKKYKKEGIGIDLDTTDYGYTIAELECMIEDGSDPKQATDKIIAFANKHNIIPAQYIRGKVAMYLSIHNPVHLQALIDAKVIK